MNATHPVTHIDDIARQAEAAWQSGLQCECTGQLDAAHQHFRHAHDLVVDCPRLHQQAHRHLLRVNLRRQAWREVLTDVVLLGLAPLWVFELVAYAMKKQVLGGSICARGDLPKAS